MNNESRSYLGDNTLNRESGRKGQAPLGQITSKLVYEHVWDQGFTYECGRTKRGSCIRGVHLILRIERSGWGCRHGSGLHSQSLQSNKSI